MKCESFDSLPERRTASFYTFSELFICSTFLHSFLTIQLPPVYSSALCDANETKPFGVGGFILCQYLIYVLLFNGEELLLYPTVLVSLGIHFDLEISSTDKYSGLQVLGMQFSVKTYKPYCVTKRETYLIKRESI